MDPAGSADPQFLQNVSGRSLEPQSWKSARFPGSDSPHQPHDCAPGLCGAGDRGAPPGPAPGPAADPVMTRALGITAAGVGELDTGLGIERVDSGGRGTSGSRACPVPETGQREKAKTI